MKREYCFHIQDEFILSNNTDPYRNLLAEVLSRAIRDYLIENGEYNAEFYRIDAMRWLGILEEEEQLDTPWSFVWICHHLDLDPDIVKKQIISLQKVPTKEFYWYLTKLPNVTF